MTHENLFGDSQSLSVSLSSSDWRNPSADLGFQMSYTEPFYGKNTTRNVQVGVSCFCVVFALGVTRGTQETNRGGGGDKCVAQRGFGCKHAFVDFVRCSK